MRWRVLAVHSASEPTVAVSQLAAEIAQAHAHLETPEGAGRGISQSL